MKRLIYIDSLRGIAALIVALFWHYSHFSYLFQSNSVGKVPPFYEVSSIRFFYEYGDIMVDLFFVLSGVIFSYTYRSSIKNSTVRGYIFFIKRFSRLYPVHLLSLIIISILTSIYYYKVHSYPIYNNNNIYHFILNLFFIQRGFADQGYSFNAPSWSLSIEAFMYILFFLQARYWNVIYSSILFIIVGLIIYRLPYDIIFLINHPIARGLIGFFSGCLLYEVFIRHDTYLQYRRVIIVFFILVVIIYALYGKYYFKISSHLMMIFLSGLLIVESHYNQLIRFVLENKIFKFLGNISLSLYLIHVPVQIVILLYFRFSHQLIEYNSSALFAIYAFSIVSIGWIIHNRFEVPVQRWLRSKLDYEIIFRKV